MMSQTLPTAVRMAVAAVEGDEAVDGGSHGIRLLLTRKSSRGELRSVVLGRCRVGLRRLIVDV